MIGENDKLYIPEWIKSLSLEELRKEKEKILIELEKNKGGMLLTKYNRKITKEQYEKAMLNKGNLTEEDEKVIFSPSEMFGYGIYDTRVIEDHGEYYVSFMLGSSCD